MKSSLALLVLLAFITALLAFRLKEINSPRPLITANKTEKKNVVRCGPDWEALNDLFEETEIPPIPGAGTHKWKISTTSDSAQFYFNQGINMYYAFHIIESMASFKKAAKFDPGCAMLYWAQALAYGPNINDVGYAASPDALNAVNSAKELMDISTPKEKMLIYAQMARYSADSTQTREKLNQLYVDKMKEAYENYPGDPDIAALYADALMLQHPWDLWRIDGTPKPWTPQIRDILEKLLAKNPNHPGANHYYIHVMEPSPYFAKAIPSADRLGKITPGLSHTVHMPSHIYLRSGNYQKGIDVNVNAVNSYKKSIPMYAPVTGNDFLYIIHNLHMKTNNAMLAGQSDISIKSAQETVESIPKEYLSIPGALGNYIQYIYMTPELVKIRFGDWGWIIEGPTPASEMKYAHVLYHFAMGMAKLKKGFLMEDVKEELASMESYMKDSSLLVPLSPFSAAIEGANVAHAILEGTIELKQKNFNKAIEHFKKAVTTEESMVYNEPRDWLLNPKHYLADAFLQAGRIKEAKETLQKDLLNNNENGWALFGLWQAFTAEKKTAEAAKIMTRFRKAFYRADVKLSGPVF